MDEQTANERIKEGIEAIRQLSEVIGPRPPCSEQEEAAAEYVSAQLKRLGLAPSTERFPSGRSFGPAQLAPFLMALAGSRLQRSRGGIGVTARRLAGHAVAGVAAWTAIGESRFRPGPVTGRLRRRESRNVVVTQDPQGEAERTVCLVCHLDSSRSGAMFHHWVTPGLGKLVAATGIALMMQTVSGPLSRVRGLRWAETGARALVWAAVGLIVEREVCGRDVPGANDNASGVGACLALAGLLTDRPLERTRVVILFTGSEESGVLGMRHFLSRHDTKGWLFLNFDGVGADAPLRVLSREGGPLAGLSADHELLELAAGVGRDDPELVATPLAHGSGLPYDSTPVLAAGGKALSVVNQGDGAIPDYHWPSDRMDRLSVPAFRRAVRFGHEMLRRIDREL